MCKLRTEWMRKFAMANYLWLLIRYRLCFNSFVNQLSEIVTGKRNATLILDDPSGNSYVQALTDDGSLDDRLKISKYTRTYEQNDELGINDMKTENYE